VCFYDANRHSVPLTPQPGARCLAGSHIPVLRPRTVWGGGPGGSLAVASGRFYDLKERMDINAGVFVLTVASASCRDAQPCFFVAGCYVIDAICRHLG
jgi:hypothetical protein